MTPALERLDWYRFLERNRLPRPKPESLRTFRNECILITGAGGSIGSALALRLSALAPARLVLLESSESRVFEQRNHWPHDVRVRVAHILGSMTDRTLLDEIFSLHAPTLVFHIAAYKQVPLLEEQPLAAIENNVFGTERVIAAAEAHRARVVLVSTDKAVDPASVMGATKRLAECMVLAADGTALRLANVLGSRDSVTEIFAGQIASGTQLTVTDPAAQRYFVTIEEAVDLLLTAALEPSRPGLFVPDLNRSHFIADLARFLSVELTSKSAEGAPVPIFFTKLRPGDKQAERLWSSGETVTPASFKGLLSIQSPLPGRGQLKNTLAALHAAMDDRNLSAALAELRCAVSGYTPSRSILELAAQADPRVVS